MWTMWMRSKGTCTGLCEPPEVQNFFASEGSQAEEALNQQFLPA
jgi:hypothetical protein